MDRKNSDSGSQSERPQHVTGSVRQDFHLTSPNLSVARDAVHSVSPETAADGEALYLQSNVPYLLLVATIFLINGFILFFGPDLRDKFDFLDPTPSASADTDETAWRKEVLDWINRADEFGEWTDLLLSPSGPMTTHLVSNSTSLSGKPNNSSQRAETGGAPLSKPETDLFR